MVMKIVFKNKIVNSGKWYEITNVKMMNQFNLPDEYISNAPSCFKEYNLLVLNGFCNDGIVKFEIGELISPYEKDLILDFIDKCGYRLQKVHRKIEFEKKKAIREWEGKVWSVKF
jgi:hypothetical protein